MIPRRFFPGAAALAALITLAAVPAAGPLQRPGPVAGPPEAPGQEALPPEGPVQQARPSLVVLVVVDQLRADLLDRYDALFTGGFRRLRDEGLRFAHASHAHAFTETAAGHATLATGTAPARHGIVANDWTERSADGSLRYVYAVSDDTVPVLGVPEASGRSPANMRRPTLGDWALAADPGARVVAISKKDRSAITTGARQRGAHVYWIDGEAGRFVTSTWYRDGYPDWVERFNRETMPWIWADTVWEARAPAEAAALARPDTSAGEKSPGWFPHRAMVEVPAASPEAVRSWVERTPAMDRAVLALAAEAVRTLDLGGRDGGADVLSVSFSATDYVGHDFGPLSREQLENLLLLDRTLGELFDLLDEEVGRGRWAMALSADHGVVTSPEWGDRADASARLPRQATLDVRSAVLDAVEAGGTREQVASRVAAALDALPYTAATYLRSDLARGESPDSFAPLYRNALFEGRYPDRASPHGVEVRFREGLLFDHGGGGSTHGSPWWYDRHVPLVLMGPGVAPGVRETPAFTFDVAPTLAAWAGIPAPDDLDGRDLRDGGR